MLATLTSAAGALSLLDEPEIEVKSFALSKLNQLVDQFWAEIADAISKIEILYEDQGFRARQLAALVASKVYYHLGAYEEALTYALGAGDLFDVNDTSEYVQTVVAKCIDEYTKLCVHNADAVRDDEKKTIDPRMEAIANRMFHRCLEDKQFRQAIGIALETRRMDMFHETIMKSEEVNEMLSYSFKVALFLIQNRHFRNTILRELVRLYLERHVPDYINVCQCFIFLDEPQAVAEILKNLLRQDQNTALLGYQIAFDLYESASQQFLSKVVSNFPLTEVATEETPEKEESMETDEDKVRVKKARASSLTDDQKEYRERVKKLTEIMSGEVTIALHMQFLIKNNHADLLIMKKTKEAVRHTICHNAAIVANGFMNCGTTSDQFLRENLEWLARATNWAKFTATASLGVIHKGHEKEALNLMSTYLPKDSSSTSAYSEGGGLYALGLIHANHGGKIVEYLTNQLKEATHEVVRHGGCLGLGLAAMGTARADIYDLLKNNLYQDDATTGEAAGIAMGLVMLGTNASHAVDDMVQYAQDTQHEKIVRGLAVGIALIAYGRLEEADPLIDTLSKDKDPIVRRAGMYTIAAAYAGTGNNVALRRLLHVAVSDVNDDVRRAAVEAIGFLLFRTPELCPSVVSLLSESFNPHVRYGAAMALGISCSGTGLKEAITLIEPMLNDPVNYVRQGALIASALIIIQHTTVTCPKVKTFRETYSKVINDKHEDVITKFGAILAQGILDAGGRNVTISLQTKTGTTDMASIVGLLVFTQFWYWFPLSHFLSLAFTPTCIIGLNAELKMPKMEFRSNAKPSTFAYPPPLEEKKDEAKEKVETAVLSITAKQKRRDAEKKSEKPEEMEVEEAKPAAEVEAEVEKKKAEVEQKKVDDTPEPDFELLTNPARVMRPQAKLISLPDDCRYQPMKDITNAGIIIMKDRRDGDPEDLVELVKAAAGGPKKEEEELPEPEPPEPFEWSDDD